MQYEYILMAIPIIIIVAFLVMIAKRMTDGERPDISSAVLGTIIIAVGLLIMVPIISSVDPQYAYDDEDKTFILYKNVTGTEFSWGSAANAESLIIKDTVTTISAGAFANFIDLKYISIPESVETIGEGALPTLKDCMDQIIEEPEAGEYVGAGDGTLYFCDDSIFRYSNSQTISGFDSDYTNAVNLVLPREHNGVTLTAVGSGFSGTSIVFAGSVPNSGIDTFNRDVYRNCASLTFIGLPDSLKTIQNYALSGISLTTIDLPDTLETIGAFAFYNDSALESIEIPKSVTSLNDQIFRNCTSLTTVSIKGNLVSIGANAFQGCTSLESFIFPRSMTSVDAKAFTSCNGITSVTFDDGFAATLNSTSFESWTFYDSDGTTVLDKTDPTALAGFTFQGTASALVKVLPDRSALTLEQTLKVQELTKAADKAAKLEESDFPISEKTDLAEA